MRNKWVALLVLLGVVAASGVALAQPVEETVETSSRVNWEFNESDSQNIGPSSYHGHAKVDKNGDIYVTSDNGNITKVYQNGTLAWSNEIVQPSSSFSRETLSTAVHNTDEAIYTAKTQDIVIDETTGDIIDKGLSFLIKIDFNGTQVWNVSYPVHHGAWASGLVIGPNDNIYSAGTNHSGTNFSTHTSWTHISSWYTNGTLRWDHNTSVTGGITSGGGYVTNNTVYYDDISNGNFWGIYTNGTERFHVDISWFTGSYGSEITGSGDGERIYLKSTDQLGAISTNDGSTVWNETLGGYSSPSSATITAEDPANKRIYLGTSNSSDPDNATALRAYNGTTGEIVWNITTSDFGYNYSLGNGDVSTVTPPIIGDDSKLYLADLDAQIYGIFPNGTVDWHINASVDPDNADWGYHNFPVMGENGTLYAYIHRGNGMSLLSISTQSDNPAKSTSVMPQAGNGRYSHYFAAQSTSSGSTSDPISGNESGNESGDEVTAIGGEPDSLIFGVDAVTLATGGFVLLVGLGLVAWRLKEPKIIWE